MDEDGDGFLSDEEVQTSALLCDGAPGATASPDLLRLVPGVLEECGGTGVRVEVGRDADGDLLLDEEEVRQSGALCNGAQGERGGDALIDVSAATTCAVSGQLVRVGLDDDADGVLSNDEVLTSRTLCDGAANDDAGSPGGDGVATLVEVIAEDVECEAGGQRVRVGTDADGSGALTNDEVSESVVLCNGVEGQGGETGPGSGVSEGTSEAPVSVSVSAFADLFAGHPGSVESGGRSYYGFTTRSDHGPMPYTIALLEAESDLVVGVREGDSSGAAVAVRCRDEEQGGVMARVCDTDPLQPSAAHVIIVRDARNVANVYVLTVSAGAAQGTTTAPVELDASALADADLLASGSVRELGESVYRFTPPLSDHVSLSLEDTDAPDGDPLLSFVLYEGEVREDRVLSSCATTACPTARVAAGVPLVLVVTASAPAAASFSIRISGGDDLTPILPHATATPAASVMQFTTAEPGSYSITLTGQGFGIAEDPDVEVAPLECLAVGNSACLFTLEGGKRYYAFTRFNTAGRQAYLQKSAGQEGSLTSPVALSLDETRACSTDQEQWGDNGSVPAFSYYSFTTAGAGPYTFDYTWAQPLTTGPALLLYADPLFTDSIERVPVMIASPRQVHVSEPLAAATTYYLVLRAYDALNIDLRVTADAPEVNVLPLDGTMAATAVPNTDVSWHRIDVEQPSALELMATGVAGTLTFNLHSESPATTAFRQVSLSSDGSVETALPAGITYLQIATVSTQTIEFGASLPAVTSLTLGAAHTRDGLLAGDYDWYRFDSVAEAVHTLSVIYDTSGGGSTFSSVQLFDDAGQLRLFGNSGASLSLLGAGEPLPVGPWLLNVRNTGAAFIDYDVQVSAP